LVLQAPISVVAASTGNGWLRTTSPTGGRQPLPVDMKKNRSPPSPATACPGHVATGGLLVPGSMRIEDQPIQVGNVHFALDLSERRRPRTGGSIAAWYDPSQRIENSTSAKAESWFRTVKQPWTTGRCSRTTEWWEVVSTHSSALKPEGRVPPCPDSGRKRRERPKTRHQEAENLDLTPYTGSNHPKMTGKTPFRSLNPQHPTPTGGSWAGGVKKRITSS
jgi:hypothetical protein